MGNNRAILTRDVNAVISHFEGVGKPPFAIFEENKILIPCIDPAPKERLRILKEYLQFMKDSGSGGKFEIRYYQDLPDGKKPTNSSEYFASLPFKVVDEGNIAGGFQNSSRSEPANMMNNFQFMNQLFDSKLATLELKYQHMLEKKDDEIRDLEEEIRDIYKNDDGVGRLGAIMDTIGAVGDKHPWMQNAINNTMNTLNTFVNGARTKLSSMTERPVSMAGVPPKPADNDLMKNLRWSQDTLIATYREKYGAKVTPEGALIDLGSDAANSANKAAMQQADGQYVADMVKLAEVASTKPNTFENAIKSLREL